MLCNSEQRCYFRALATLPVILVLGIIAWEWYGLTIYYYPRRHPYLFSIQTLSEVTLPPSVVVAEGLLFIFIEALFVLLVWAYFAVVFTPPGFASETWQENNRSKRNYEFCTKCSMQPPPRAMHCCICGHCVLKQDHHCPWVANCVGFRNHKFFIQFLGFASGTALAVCFKILLSPSSPRVTERTMQYPVLGFNMVFMEIVVSFFAGSVGASLLIMCGMHIFLVCTNQTSPELTELFDNDRGLSFCQRLRNSKYTLGSWKANWRATMGPGPLHWVLPINHLTDRADGREGQTRVIAVTLNASTSKGDGSRVIYLDGERWPSLRGGDEEAGLLYSDSADTETEYEDEMTPEYTTMDVLVPEGMKAGDRVRITAASGTEYTVVVPAGFGAGDKFLCNVPRR